ncbi:MAG TPA: Zn-ribbon domain-containing OB-fold protein [Actinomycetota bacterium]|nr:Zn-ribbon domain-containing OB-fold protein [Actinomycetota bacterium]
MFEKLTDPKDIILHEGRVPIRHRYTPGVGGEAFFLGLKERGEFVASRCESCGITYCPARLFCERCFAGPLEPDVVVGPGGTLLSFSVGYTGLEGEALDEPVVVGLVRLDGADTVLLHFVVDAAELATGLRVEPVFAAARQRTGSILDLRGFRPARNASR